MRKTEFGATVLEGHDIADLPLVSQNAEILEAEIKKNRNDLTAHKAKKATQDTLGHIKVGQGLEIESDGTLNVNAGGGVPSGLIAMWSGEATSIPDGWALCDGQNGTPDLRDRFIVGAGNEYNVGDTGGEASHTLTIDEMPSHNHYGSTRSNTHSHSGSTSTDGSHFHRYSIHDTSVGLLKGDEAYLGAGSYHTKTSTDGSHSHTFTTNSDTHSHTVTINSTGGGLAHENRPPYYALAFIMKL